MLIIINFCLLTSAPVVDQLKEVIDEVDGLHSSNNAEDKYKIHKILEESSQMVSFNTLHSYSGCTAFQGPNSFYNFILLFEFKTRALPWNVVVV